MAARLPARAGSPQVVSHLGFPRIRTCPIQASGSSSHRFAACVSARTRRSTSCRNVRVEPGKRGYPLLSRVHEIGVRCLRHVSLQRFSDSTPSFPRPGPVRDRFPGFRGTVRALRPLLVLPARLLSFARAVPLAASSASLLPVLDTRPEAWKFAVRHSPADSTVGTSRSPRFLENPLVRSPGS